MYTIEATKEIFSSLNNSRKARLFLYLFIAVFYLFYWEGISYAVPLTFTLEQFDEKLLPLLEGWERELIRAARNLFVLLAVLEIAWSTVPLLFRGAGADISEFLGHLARKIIWIGFFYMLLDRNDWLRNAIWGSFTKLSRRAASNQVHVDSPASILQWGRDIANKMITPQSEQAKKAGVLDVFVDTSIFVDTAIAVLMTPFAVIFVICSALFALIVLCITIEFIFKSIVGMIVLGLGGHSFTSSYAHRSACNSIKLHEIIR